MYYDIGLLELFVFCSCGKNFSRGFVPPVVSSHGPPSVRVLKLELVQSTTSLGVDPSVMQ
jgi:hypothetical protein